LNCGIPISASQVADITGVTHYAQPLFLKSYKVGQMQWHMAVIPALGKLKHKEAVAQPGLHRKFQASLSYTVRPYLTKT
jgi:hypothetical protein